MGLADDLIVACGTPPGQGPRTIVRLAGDGLGPLLDRLFAPRATASGPATPPHRPRLVSARLAGPLAEAWGEIEVDILHWPGPAGPIGGPLAEVQLPGSRPLADALVAEACRQGARLARGGEFTLRGFLSGRLDLLQAEAVLAVIDARSSSELAAALDRLAGGAGSRLRELRDDLLDVLADVEAAIDFADETTPDAPPAVDVRAWTDLAGRIGRAARGIDGLAAGLAARDASAGDLPRVVIVGPPNIGKSSLFNALCGREAALVADEPGTTRDLLEARMELAGPAGGPALCCLLVDLAGFASVPAVSPGGGPVAAGNAADLLGQIARVARGAAAVADVLVVCHDAAAAPDSPGFPPHREWIAVTTRCDRVAAREVGGEREPAARPVSGPPGADASALPTPIATSSRTGEGLARLRAALAEAVARLPPRDTPATVRLRVGLAAAGAALGPALEAAHTAAAGGPGDEAILAVHLRTAVEALNEVTGLALGPDLIERIFSRHCVGK